MIRSSSLPGSPPSACQAREHPRHVAVVVGAPDVDHAVEAALALVLVVGDVGREVGVLARGAHAARGPCRRRGRSCAATPRPRACRRARAPRAARSAWSISPDSCSERSEKKSVQVHAEALERRARCCSTITSTRARGARSQGRRRPRRDPLGELVHVLAAVAVAPAAPRRAPAPGSTRRSAAPASRGRSRSTRGPRRGRRTRGCGRGSRRRRRAGRWRRSAARSGWRSRTRPGPSRAVSASPPP